MTDSDVIVGADEAAPVLNWLEQDDILRDLWVQNLPPQVISEKLGRSIAAIMTRAARLGLPRRAQPGRKPGSRSLPRDPSKPRPERVTRRRRMGKDEAEVAVDAVRDPAMRVCLMCLNRFSSEGRFNRICPSCKGTSEYAAGSSIPEITLGGA